MVDFEHSRVPEENLIWNSFVPSFSLSVLLFYKCCERLKPRSDIS